MFLRYKRRYAESLVYNGDMIIMGGYNNQQGWLNSVEKVSSSGEISELPDWKLPRKIFDLCAVQMDNGKIMVIGGNNLIYQSKAYVTNISTNVLLCRQ